MRTPSAPNPTTPPFEWETNVAPYTSRLPVPGGWIYLYHFDDHFCAVYVPKPILQEILEDH